MAQTLSSELSVPLAQSATPTTPSPAPPRLLANCGHSEGTILKPPRSPLRDLRDGNEIVQEPNASRNKKSSRRVSFADTIKVYQTESHMKIVRKSEIAGIILHRIISVKLLISVIEYNHEEKHSNDQTVIFSDENQMDLTASHTVMITRGLLDCTKSDKSTKTDTTSFVANLKHSH
ncbi:hypothetical protein QTO34_019600 [Cnephaeus nilssonii]|uniref:Uncharacterized protein n=1 Tax=Cnephaeus nilssonii TaxID=3371016 RepID=A0AA40HXS0_CNENI|nr:hypothetical protein QTO34_019600 [Eptesicus nilssonii]